MSLRNQRHTKLTIAGSLMSCLSEQISKMEQPPALINQDNIWSASLSYYPLDLSFHMALQGLVQHEYIHLLAGTSSARRNRAVEYEVTRHPWTPGLSDAVCPCQLKKDDLSLNPSIFVPQDLRS